MSGKAPLTIFTACALVISQCGCHPQKLVTRRSELEHPEETGKIRVFTHDGARYDLYEYVLTDSLLIGRGPKIVGRDSTFFVGTLRLADIDHIAASRSAESGVSAVSGVVGGVWVIAVFAPIAFYCVSKAEELEIEDKQKQVYVGGGYYCCPFIYTYDGLDYHFESETFADAVLECLERSSYDMAQYLEPADGEYLLRLTNERSETHYVNEVRVLAVDAPRGLKVITDNNGNLHTIGLPVPPISCVDFAGRDVLDYVIGKDTLMWETDLAAMDLTQDENLRDGLILEFRKPPEARSVKLVVGGANTALGFFALELFFSLRGENLCRWYQRLQRDPEERARVTQFIEREGRLHVSVMSDGDWSERAALVDPGPMIEKEHVVVLDLSGVQSEAFRVKLESTTDLWRINHVYVDYSEDASIDVTDALLLSAVDQDSNDVADLLQSDDDKYLVTIPGDSVQLRFKLVAEKPDRERSYVLKSKGFYHMWIDPNREPQEELADRIFAEPLYAARMYMPFWRTVRDRYER